VGVTVTTIDTVGVTEGVAVHILVGVSVGHVVTAGVGVGVSVGDAVGLGVFVGVAVRVGTTIVVSGARATPRNAVFAAAVARRVGVPFWAPLYPLVSRMLTSSPPPVAPDPPLRVAKRVTLVSSTIPVTPR
jgi:hypothetical protein